MKQPEVRIFSRSRDLSRAAAQMISDLAVAAIASRGRFTIALSGGTTPRPVYILLASSPFRESIPWEQVAVFWSDERCVPRDSQDSNYKPAFDLFLAQVPLPEKNIHSVAGEEKPERAAALYEEDLRKAFDSSPVPLLDLVLLGVGTDGHTASLFPGSGLLQEKTRLAAPVYFDPPGFNRVTLTLPVLNNARSVVFLATGRAKAAIIREILEKGNPENRPAGLVHPPEGALLWMLDAEAGSLLSGSGERF